MIVALKTVETIDLQNHEPDSHRGVREIRDILRDVLARYDLAWASDSPLHDSTRENSPTRVA